MINNQLFSRLRIFWPAIILSVITFILCIISEWQFDAIEYQFFIPEEELDGVIIRRIESIKDIWISQCNHYQYYNGRFAIHFLVQLFCGLLGKFWFAFFNAIVTGILALIVVKLGNEQKIKTSILALSSLLLYILFFTLPLEPPFYINYVWSAFFVAAWALPFFSKKKLGLPALILYFILGFIAGECNESFSAPVSIAIIIYAILHKFRLSRNQWIGAIAFAVGSIVLISAPSNWNRLEAVSSSENIEKLKYVIETVILCMPIPVIFVIAKLLMRKHRIMTDSNKVLFFSIVAITNFIIAIMLMFCSGTRMVIAGSLALIILTLAIPFTRKILIIFNSSLSIICAIVIIFQAQNAIQTARFTQALYSSYSESTDGRAIITDDIIVNCTNAYLNLPKVYNKECRYLYPGKPDLRLRPASLKNLKEETDTNLLIKVNDDFYIIVESKHKPAEFIVEKTFLPGLIGKKMAPRYIDFRKEKHGCIDSTENVLIGIYANERPYLDSHVIMHNENK